MSRIPVPHLTKAKNPIPSTSFTAQSEGIVFSFASLDRNEYFNLDGTCQNWASDLFSMMQEVSQLKIKDIRAGRYSGKGLRIHNHAEARPPCPLPDGIQLEDFYQIRISKSKGGIHGIFIENVFYVVWFDPQHNMYPNENYGGLKKVVPPSTCCKDRDTEIADLKAELAEVQKERDFWESNAIEIEKESLRQTSSLD